MPKSRKEESGSRRYNSYSEKDLLKAMIAIKEGKISITRAAIKYNIAKGTLINKLHGKHHKNFGAAPLFTQEEEKTLVDHIVTIKGWGYPFTMNDLRYLGKFYLDILKKEPPRFGADNMPGQEWASRFMKKYKKTLNCKYPQNLGKTRKEKTAFILTDFFGNLQESLMDKDSEVKPGKIFNFTLANLSYDPLAVQCFYKQSKKYASCITDSVASVVFCGSALGHLIPPFVVYKADCMSEYWMKGGPKNTKYSVSPSGCFDPHLFLEWFETLFIPYVKNLRGRIVLLGDYPSSLFSPKVLELAEENSVIFTCIPSGVSRSYQPFEYSFYATLEFQWLLLLEEWREAKGPGTMERRFFPETLNRLLMVTCKTSDDAGGLYSKELEEGFKECGIVPFSSDDASLKVENILYKGVKKKTEHSEAFSLENVKDSPETISGCKETVRTKNGATSVNLSQQKNPDFSDRSMLVKEEKLTKAPVIVYLVT